MTTVEGFAARRVRLAPFGLHTRYFLRHYTFNSLVIVFALLCVALTVDVLPQISAVLADTTGRSGLPPLERLGWYTLLRSANLLPRFIPLAAFLGVLWTEVAQTLSRERILISNTGRSWRHRLVPVALFALCFGVVQFACDAYVRPWAMEAQIRERLGSDGADYDRGLSKTGTWVAFGDDAVEARFAYAPVPTLYDATFYRLSRDGRLREIDKARSAVPDSARGTWLLQRGTYWPAPQLGADGSVVESQTLREPGLPFTTRRVQLAIDALHLGVWGLPTEYLSLGTLDALVRNTVPGESSGTYLARLEFDYANALMPGAMALLAVVLSLMLFQHDAPPLRQLIALPVGYSGHLAMKTFALMGGREYIGPLIAGWFVPIVLLSLSAALLAMLEWRRRNGGGLR